MWRDYCQRYTPNELSAIKHNRLVCIGGVKLAGLDRVSFDAITHAAITSTDNKGRLELSICASQSAYRLIVCLSICLSATFMLNISETKRFRGSCPIADAHGAIDDVIDDVT